VRSCNSSPESTPVEYKEKLAESVAQGVAALGNTYGGIMLIGVTDDRRIVGVNGEMSQYL
jgi:predicted HTH transcriptional regulator